MSTVVGIINKMSASMAADTQITNHDLTVSEDTTLKICSISPMLAVGATGETGHVFPLFNYLYNRQWPTPLFIEDVQKAIVDFLQGTSSSGDIMIIGQSEESRKLCIATCGFRDLTNWNYHKEDNNLVVLSPQGKTQQDCYQAISQALPPQMLRAPLSQICSFAVKTIAQISPYVGTKCAVWQFGRGIVLHEQ